MFTSSGFTDVVTAPLLLPAIYTCDCRQCKKVLFKAEDYEELCV